MIVAIASAALAAIIATAMLKARIEQQKAKLVRVRAKTRRR